MSKYKKSARKRQTKTLADVTINDFANSTAAKHRPKKSSTSVTNIIKQLEDQQTSRWDDPELEDYDYIKQENDEGKIVYVLQKVHKIKVELDHRLVDTIDKGRDYPVDIWFLISKYIRPEDIGTFSCICQTSYSIVNTGKFWFSLYRRYYRNLPELPKRLQPNCMFRLYGIRTLVIKSLYYMYTPFIDKLKLVKTEEHPDVLAKRLCVLMWHQKFKSLWVYYFKLKEVIYSACVGRPICNEKKLDLIDRLEDITANSEDSCRILQITCLNFIPVLPVQGLFLTSVAVTLSQGFRHNRIQLGFNSNVMHGKAATEGTVGVLLDPVVNVRILDWWHPLYPHNYNLELPLHDE